MRAGELAQIGGMLFVMELSTRWRRELTWRTFFACAVTSFTMAACASGCVTGAGAAAPQRCAFYTSGGLLNVGRLNFSAGARDIGPVAALGVIGGLGGALFNRVNVHVRTRV